MLSPRGSPDCTQIVDRRTPAKTSTGRCRQPMPGRDADAVARYEAHIKAGLFAGPPPFMRTQGSTGLPRAPGQGGRVHACNCRRTMSG